MQTNEKNKKTSDPSLKDCANCGTVGAKLTCAKCKATEYCSKACQKHHWKNGHKDVCVIPEERRPRMVVPAAEKTKQRPLGAADAAGECPICLESVLGGVICTLPCKHAFHRDCVEKLRKQGVHQLCPLCRTSLPAGPEKLYKDATCLYESTAGKHREVGLSWKPSTRSEEEAMAQVVEMTTNAANQGYARAQCHLGLYYQYGSGVAQDFNEAMQCHRKAADQGDRMAQFSLGNMYHNGEGVAQDFKKAVHWLRKAADQGEAMAQCSLGAMYMQGKGVAQDFKKAVHWLRKAADQGDSAGQYNLGVLYRYGHGVAQDFKRAHFFLSAAEVKGYEGAHELRLELDALLRQLTSERSCPDASPPSKCVCCGHGADKGVRLKPCPRCKGPLYCGKDCQREHWKKGHKEHCTQKCT